VFAVGGVVAEAAVEDADKAVAQGAQGLVVHRGSIWSLSRRVPKNGTGLGRMTPMSL
jgi:hypothetical protein